MALTDVIDDARARLPRVVENATRTQLIVRAVLLLLIAHLALSLYNGLRIRLKFRKLRSQGIVRSLMFSHSTAQEIHVS